MEAMPKTIKRTLSGSDMAPPFHRTPRISLNYCAAYFFRKDGVCVVLAYFFPGRVRRLFLPGTLQVRSKHVNDTVRYGNFFLTPTVSPNKAHPQWQVCVPGSVSLLSRASKYFRKCNWEEF